jgi:hypothetical protein
MLERPPAARRRALKAARDRRRRQRLRAGKVCVCVEIDGDALGLFYPFCRKLLAAGFDWQRPLHVYRGDVLCITVKSIGEGARWHLAENDKTGFSTTLWTPSPFARSATDPKILAGIEAASAARFPLQHGDRPGVSRGGPLPP